MQAVIDSTDDSDDEDSGMQGQARPVDVRRFPQAVVDDHEARAQTVQLQESDDDDVPGLKSSSDDGSGSELEDEVDEEDEQTSKFWTPSDAFLHCDNKLLSCTKRMWMESKSTTLFQKDRSQYPNVCV